MYRMQIFPLQMFLFTQKEMKVSMLLYCAMRLATLNVKHVSWGARKWYSQIWHNHRLQANPTIYYIRSWGYSISVVASASTNFPYMQFKVFVKKQYCDWISSGKIVGLVHLNMIWLKITLKHECNITKGKFRLMGKISVILNVCTQEACVHIAYADLNCYSKQHKCM